VGISGCCAGAVPSKQAKQTSKGLVLDAGAVAVVRVQGAGLSKQRFGLVWCCVWVLCQAKVKCFVPVLVYLTTKC